MPQILVVYDNRCRGVPFYSDHHRSDLPEDAQTRDEHRIYSCRLFQSEIWRHHIPF
jgi:hypothetical protein